jgi:hypothetical protein
MEIDEHIQTAKQEVRHRRTLPVPLPIIVIALAIVVASGGIYIGGVNAAAKKRMTHSFHVRGKLAAPLHPGDRQVLRLTVINRKPFSIWVTRLKVRATVDRRHVRAGCSATRDFKIMQIRRKAFPIRLGPKTSKRRRAKTTRTKISAVVSMRNLGRVNQDACKGAKLHFIYRGRATKPRNTGRIVNVRTLAGVAL